MSRLSHKAAVFAASAGLAFAGIAAPVAAAGHNHHWSTAKCDRKAAHWTRSHRHPTQRQIKRENRNLAKHGCTNTVS
jgi:hypothetical protein